MLGVWAHPDDEAYLSAGLMAEYRRRGDRVVVVTATLGERGTNDPVAWPPERLAVLREHELRASLAALGVDELHLLGFMDGECTWNDGTDRIAELIAEIAPDLIVTFGPDGMTGHPDHRAVSAWTTDAWRVGTADADLWYATLGTDFHAQWGALSDHVGLWAEQPSPPCTADQRSRRARHARRRVARPQARRAAGPRLADDGADRSGRPRHLPRVVAHRVLRRRRTSDNPTLPP